jgi:uncharacterized protein
VAHFYFDTSALVKYYVLEPGSTWVRSVVDASETIETGDLSNTIAIADVSITETTAAFAVLHRTRRISHRTWRNAVDLFMAHLVQQWIVIDTGRQDFVAAAMLTQTHPLRAYDAVQLAVALRYDSILSVRHLDSTFVSGDRTLLTAANTEGLQIDNPFDHVLPQDTSSSPGQ